MTNLYEQFQQAGHDFAATLQELHNPDQHNHITFANWAQAQLNQSKEDN